MGPALGLTPVLHQSGESNRVGRISLCGDAMMRTLLFEAAQVMLTRVTRWSWLKAWAMKVAQRRGDERRLSHWRAVGGHPASHLAGRHRVPLDQGGSGSLTRSDEQEVQT